jgi:hypothetical protein
VLLIVSPLYYIALYSTTVQDIVTLTSVISDYTTNTVVLITVVLVSLVLFNNTHNSNTVFTIDTTTVVA